jgi:hypothetical protein
MNRVILLLLACLPLVTSCRSHPEVWAPEEIPLCSNQRLWEVSRMALHKNGFPIVHRGFDPKTNTAISGWDEDLMPFRMRGIRERAYVRFKRADTPGKLVLDVRVEQEANSALRDQQNSASAEWVVMPDNLARAKVVLQYIRSLVGSSLEVGKKLTEKEIEFRADQASDDY